jgi:hypothetical protein
MHGKIWMLEILPFMEYNDLYKQWDYRKSVIGNGQIILTDIKGFYCPTRRAGLRAGDTNFMLDTKMTGGGNDYGGCVGRMNGWKNDLANHHQFETLFAVQHRHHTLRNQRWVVTHGHDR